MLSRIARSAISLSASSLRGHRTSVVLMIASLGLLATIGFAADATPEGASGTGLGVRQQRVARMMSELERRFLALAKTIEMTEPERAAKLVKAFEESKALLVEQRMNQIVTLLDGAKLENAGKEQQQVVEDVRRLLAILISDGSDKDATKEEIERLREWHQQISMLIRDEQQQQAESRKLDKKDEALDQLKKQIESVEQLIKREEDLIRKTAAAMAESVSDLTPLADRQQTIRNDTEFTAQNAAKAGGAPNAGPPAPPKPNAGAPAAQGETPPPGQQPLQQATKRQQAAEEKLQTGEGKAAQKEEEQALAELRKALDELKKEQDRLANPPMDALDKLAQKQDQTANKTNQLGEQMAKAGKPGTPGASACSSGSQCMGKAGQCMAQASNSLKKQSPSGATPQQKQAEEELKKAQEQIEKRLEELGQKLKEEVIVRLEDIFREMLGRQQLATQQTAQVETDRKSEKDGELKRADRLTVRRLAQEERDLAAMAVQALELLEKDATSVSFPAVVANMKDNLEQIAVLLDEQRTEEFTRSLQQEVERTLEELIEALQVAKKQGNSEGQCKGGNCKPKLLPNTAELKLLRAMQLRINRRTKSVDEARPDGVLDQVVRQEVVRITKLQQELGGMVKAIVERNEPEAPKMSKEKLPGLLK